MRPIELTMQAFGPYAKETVIPFEKISRGGLYLICGDTGSGKTMIFDAITYVLYGDPSGSNRDKNMLRSKYAAPGDMTSVKLVFENGGKNYTVYREYGREKLKKGVLTEEKSAEAWLLYPDGRTVAKHSDVTKAVTDILGLDRDRFTKTVMIAQGEFRKLLYSETKDRMVILRRIFGTELFERFSASAKDEARKAESTAAALRTDAKKYAAMIRPGNDDLAALLTAVPAVPVTRLGELLDSDAEQQESIIKELDGKLTALGYEISEARLRLSRAKIDRDREKELEKCRTAVTVGAQKLKEAEQEAGKTAGFSAEAEVLRVRAAAHETSLPAYTELEKLRSSLNDEKDALGEIEQKREKTLTRIALAEEEIGKLAQFIETNAHAAEDCRHLEEKIGAMNAEHKRLSGIARELKALDSAKKDGILKQKAYESSVAELSVIRRRHTEAMRSYFDGIAGVLAKNLTDGEPCPVCGSVDHPSPARSDSTSVTREMLDELSRKSECAAKNAEKAASDLAQCRGTVDQLTSGIETALSESGLDVSAGEASAVIGEKMRGIESDIRKAKDTLDEYARIAEQLELSRDRHERSLKVLEAEKAKAGELSAGYAAKSAVIGEKQAQAEALSKKLPFEDASALNREVSELRSRADALIKAENDTKTALESAKTEYNTAKSALETVASQLKDSIAAEHDAIEEKCRGLDDAIGRMNEEKLRIMTAAEGNRRAARLLLGTMEELGKAEENALLYASVSDTANGSISGKEKIMLETFWQMRLFERILRRANIRLMQMTDGRYELVRRKTAADQRSQSGLDMDILDHWNGSFRSVKSLSGGESFTASLALALALSDETEAEAGGVKIDAMFIDEGFGSLDEESLNQAMAVLENQSLSGKSIGIISHVESLRERIMRKIIVRKQSGTSRVEFEGV